MSQAEVSALISETQSHYGKIEQVETGLTAADALVPCKEFRLMIEELMAEER